MAITISGATLAEVLAQADELRGSVASAPVESKAADAPAESSGGRRGGRKAKDDAPAADTSKEPEEDRTVDEIKEIAAKITDGLPEKEGDAMMDKVIAIIAETGAGKASDLADKPASVRVKVYNAIAALAEKPSRRALD